MSARMHKREKERRHPLSFFCVVLWPILLVWASSVFAQAPAPKLVCSESTFDFGTRSNTDTVKHGFLLKNEGTGPLFLNKVHGCCGAETSVSSKIVPPGSNATVSIEFKLHGRNGAQSKAIYVSSNDPQQPYYTLKLMGTVVAPVRLDPPYLRFEALMVTSREERVTQLFCQTDAVLQITNAIGGAPSFDVSYERQAGGGPTGALYRISVRTAPPLSNGVRRATITLLTDSAAHPRVSLSVSASVEREILVVPGEMVLTGGTNAPAQDRYVAVRSRHKQAFKVLGVETPAPHISGKHESLAPGSWRITLTNLQASAELDGEKVVVHTDWTGEETLEIPIRVVGR